MGMISINFIKMVGAGNDFIILDNRAGVVKNGLPRLAKALSDRKRSIGSDGLILLERSKKADVRMRIFNPDGSEADMCGNGVRCLAKFAADRKITGTTLSVETGAGIIGAEVRKDSVKAKMIEPRDMKLGLCLEVGGRSVEVHFINTGVPHAVMVTDAVDAVDVFHLGRAIRRHERFAPAGANANFIAFGKGSEIRVRTYERGVEDETLSCGTGSTAGALVAAALEDLKSPVKVRTRGGESLKVFFKRDGDTFRDVYLEGPVEKSFEGRVSI